MKLTDQYVKLVELKSIIDTKLKDLEFIKTKELIVWLTQNVIYQKLKRKDNQLLALDFFVSVWLQENKYRNTFAMQGDIFYGIDCLEAVERKYNSAKFAIFRIEADMPIENYKVSVREVIQYKFSSYSLFRIILEETCKKEKNLIKLARVLKGENELLKAIGLLEKGTEEYPENSDMWLELADCWVHAQMEDKAYECLMKISNPSENVKISIAELVKVLKNEKI